MVLGSWLKSAAQIVRGRPVLFLSRQGKHYTLSAWQRGRPAPLDSIIERHEALSVLCQLDVRPGSSGVIVPAEKLTDVRLALQAAVSDRLEVAISPDVAYLHPGKAAENASPGT